MMKRFAVNLCAALLLALGLASPAAAQMCSDGEVLIVASHLNGPPGGKSGYEIRELPVNLGFNGENGQAIYDQLVASDAFVRGGVLDGFKPNSVFAPFSEFIREVIGGGGEYTLYGVGAQLLQCSSAKKLNTESWRSYCEDGRFLPGVYLMSGKAVRKFDMDKLPINPQRCSDPSRLGDPAFALRAGYTHWAPRDSTLSGFRLAYNITLEKGESGGAYLYYSGTEQEDGEPNSGRWPDNSNKIIFLMALTSGDEPITGFDGVTLRDDGGRELETFYSTTSDYYKVWEFSGEPRCGARTLAAISDDIPAATCTHQCFLIQADLFARRGEVSCINGGAHWIRIEIAGKLIQNQLLPPAGSNASQVRREMDVTQRKEAAARKRRGELTLTEKVERAGSIAVHVKWKGSDFVAIPVDDVFRTSLWNPEK